MVVSELAGSTSYQDVFDAVYFYSEVLKKNKATFLQWKQKRVFNNNLGTERNQKVSIEEIEEFLSDKRFKKYRKTWENR